METICNGKLAEDFTSLDLDNRLIPTENYLAPFSFVFNLACAQTPKEMDCMGLYCMGWEL